MKTFNLRRTALLWLPALALASILNFASCGDDVTNNNYYIQEPEVPPTEEEPQPSHPEGEWVDRVYNLCYYGFYMHQPVLYPAWLLQAEGVKRYYADSPFAQEYITDDLLMTLRNPGAGTRITLRMEASDICHASEYSCTVPQEKTDEYLALQIPVDWDCNALLAWHNDRLVNLKWTLLLDGQEVDRHTEQFNCRSLRCYFFTYYHDKSIPENIAFIDELKKIGLGSYSMEEDDKYLWIYNDGFFMGYIDEQSPLIDRLKDSVIRDGIMPCLPGLFSTSFEEMVESSAKSFCYLLLKHRVAYSARYSDEAQYMRTIDELFANRQGYCVEFAMAFASWCMNQGVPCTLEFVPGHLSTSVYSGDQVCAADMTRCGSRYTMIPPFANPPTDENMEDFLRLYSEIMNSSNDTYENVYLPAMQAGDAQYHLFDPAPLRPYLPSFNIGERYAATRTAAPTKAIKPVKSGLWKKAIEGELTGVSARTTIP